jgi:hypothetical protein
MADDKNVFGFILNKYVLKQATLLIAVVMLFLTWQDGRFNGNYINSDGKGYYAYLPAIFIYQDWDYTFVDEYEKKYYEPANYFHFKNEIHEDIVNKYFAGAAILWLPFFLAAHLGSMVMGLPTDGYAPLYQYAIGFAAIIYLLLALWGLKKLLELYGVNKYHIILIQVIIVFATPMYFYTTVDASFTHVYSFALITLFFYYAKRYFMHARAKHLYLLSLLLGLILLTRPTNIVVLAALPFFAGSWQTFRDALLSLLKEYRQLAISILIMFAILCIQPILYYIQLGEFLVWAYTDEGFNFTSPQITNVLISYKKGLFVYTPVLIFALLGFFHLLRRNIYEAFSLFFYMLLVTYVISSWWSWSYGMSYGHRAFLDHYAVFGILFGMALGDNSFKVWRYMIYLVTPVLIVVNLIQVYQYNHWILYWDMDEDRYWRVFLKTDESYEGLLWEEARQLEKEKYQKEMEAKFRNKVVNNIYVDDFEGELPGVNPLMLEEEIIRSDSTSIQLSKKFPYSPGIEIRVGELADTSRMLIKASAWVYVPDIPKMNKYALVCSIENAEGAYHYNSAEPEPEDIVTGDWNKIELVSEAKNLRSPKDILKVYVWYMGEQKVFVDDLTVEFY